MFNCDFGKKECGLLFVAGIVAGAVGSAIARTDKTREKMVKGLAKGMMCKDSTMEYLTNLREDAEDICTEAREMAKEKSEIIAE